MDSQRQIRFIAGICTSLATEWTVHLAGGESPSFLQQPIVLRQQNPW